MEIVLRINGEDKTFVNDFVSAYDTRKAAKINRKIINGELNEENVEDKIIEFVVDLFDRQFTAEEALKGIRANEYIAVFMGIYQRALRLSAGLTDEDEDVEVIEAEPGK